MTIDFRRAKLLALAMHDAEPTDWGGPVWVERDGEVWASTKADVIQARKDMALYRSLRARIAVRLFGPVFWAKVLVQ